MNKLVRKLSKPPTKKNSHADNDVHENVKPRARYRDVDGERDWDFEDVDADTLFREMRRREY